MSIKRTRSDHPIAPSARTFDDVRELAIKAAESDRWMTPVPEDHVGRKTSMEATNDYGQFVGYHRDGWEETDHFDHFYRHTIGDLALMEALRYGIGRDQSKDGKFWIGGFHDWETYHYALFTPLIDAFWEAWEEAVDLHGCWEKAVEHYKLDTHNLFTGSYWPGMKQSE